MSCVFSGPPRAGKTTVVKRLKGEDVDITEITASTGVVDEKGIVRIDFIPSSNVVTDQEWVEMEEDDEVQAFLNLTIIPQQTGSDGDEEESNMDVQTAAIVDGSSATTETPTSIAVETPSQAIMAQPRRVARWNKFRYAFKPGHKSVADNKEKVVPQLPYSTKSSSLTTSIPSATVMSQQHEIFHNVTEDTDQESDKGGNTMVELSPKSVLRRAQLHSQQIRATRRLCKRHFLYLSDTGGQPEFRKMIALLVPGPSNTFIVFRMTDEFNSSYPVRYCHRINDDEIEYSSFSIKVTMNDIIEHIFCSELHSKVKSSIMFIGTHKDLIPIEQREEIIMRRNKKLLQILEQCPHYHPDMVIRSDEMNIIFCVDNSTFETEHRCIRSSVMSICESERFQVKVKPELMLLALTLKGAKVTVLPYDKCVEVAMDCGIAEEDVRESLVLLHEKLMMIRVYKLNEDDTIVVVKPKALINKVSSLLKYMITRDEQVYSKPVVSYKKLKEIAADGEFMEADVLMKIFVHLLIIAPIPKSENETVGNFVVPAMFPDSIPVGTEITGSTVPSIFSDSTPKAVRARTEPNQLLFAFKPFKFSVPSTLHAPVLCSLLQDKQWSIQNTDSDASNTCIVFSKEVESTAKIVTFAVTFFKECVSLCLGQEWNKSNEMLQQCIYANKATTSALKQSMKLVGYGDHDLLKYCFSCFEKSFSSADIHGDCSTSHAITPAYGDNVWFSKVSFFCADNIYMYCHTTYHLIKQE